MDVKRLSINNSRKYTPPGSPEEDLKEKVQTRKRLMSRRRRTPSPQIGACGNVLRFHVRLENTQGKEIGLVLKSQGPKRYPFVTSITCGSPISNTKRVQIGDQLLSVNGIPVKPNNIPFVKELLAKATTSGVIVVQFQRFKITSDEPICDNCVKALLAMVASLIVIMLIIAGIVDEAVPQHNMFVRHTLSGNYMNGQSNNVYLSRNGAIENSNDLRTNQDKYSSSTVAHTQDSQTSYVKKTDSTDDNSRYINSQGDTIVRPQDMYDLYTIMQVAKGASLREIKASYKKLILKFHPDKRNGNLALFESIQHAYEILSNGDLRFLYDLYPFEPGRGRDAVSQFLEFEDLRSHQLRMAQNIHNHQYRHGNSPPPLGIADNPLKGQKDHRRLTVQLEDIYAGRLVRTTMERISHCRGCRQQLDDTSSKSERTFKQTQAPLNCTKCRVDRCPLVKKLVERPHPIIRGMMMTQEIEVLSGELCRKESFELEFRVPRGARDDHVIIFPRQSHHFPGIIPGDLFLHLEIADHPLFKRLVKDETDAINGKGTSVLLHHKISLVDALLGKSTHAIGIGGEVLVLPREMDFDSTTSQSTAQQLLSFPRQIIFPGYRETIRNKGLPRSPEKSVTVIDEFNSNVEEPNSDRASRSSNGDLIVEYEVVFPSGKLSAEAKIKLSEALH